MIATPTFSLTRCSALQTYFTSTDTQHPYPQASVFIDLQPPYRAIQAGKFANTLEEATVRIEGMVNKLGLNGMAAFTVLNGSNID